MARIKETHFIRNNANSNVGTVLMFYSDGTYSMLDNINFSNFKKFFNKETEKETQGKVFDGSRKDVQSAIAKAIHNRQEVPYANSDSALYEENNKNNAGTAIARGTTLDDRNNVGKTAVAEGTTNNPDLRKEKDNNNWKYAVGGAAAVAALGGAAYVMNKNKDDKKDKDSMEGKDWKYYLENAKESDQKTAMSRIYDVLERLNLSQNWMRTNDGTSKWGITPEQALSMYTYFNDLSTEELAQIYNGETVNVDKVMEEANQGMIAMSFFYANDTVGDTTIADLFNDQASKKVIADFTEIQARYNRASNDKERTAIAKEKKQMYYDYFMNNSSSKYVDVSSVPGASFVINTMFPVDFVRYFRSSADLGEYDEILVTGRYRDDGTVEHRSKVDSACGGLKADLEKYNEDIKELKAEYNAKKNSGFRFSKETEYEKLTKDVYDPQVILDMMTQNLKTIDKYPVNVNTFNSTIDGERKLIPVGGSYGNSGGSVSYSRPSVGGGASVQQPAGTQEFTGNTPEEAAKKAIEAGAPKEMVDQATQTIIKENEKAKEEAEEKADKLHNFYQGYYDDVFNGDKDKDEYDKAIGVIKDAEKDKKEYDDAMEKDGTTTGGEITNKGSEVNDDGSIDLDLDGDGQKEHIPAHNDNDKDNPYNMPDYADGAFDVEKNNSDDEIVYDDPNAVPSQSAGNNAQAGDKELSHTTEGRPAIDGVHIDGNGENTSKPVEEEKPIEQNPISDEELGDMTFSGGATSVGTSGGEVTDFTEDQLVDQVKDSQDSQETEIDGSIVSGSTTGGEVSSFDEDQLVSQLSDNVSEQASGYSMTIDQSALDNAEDNEEVEVASFTAFAKEFYDQEAAKEAQVEQQEEVANEPVKTLK